MESASHLVREFIASRDLPRDLSSFLDEFDTENKNILELQEGTLWDYKKEFPFSRSDDYFGGILRLICALHNTLGGLIIFGVEDKTRRIVGNKVRINVESFNAVLRERLSIPVECIARRYEVSNNLFLDILLVPKRVVGQPPVHFSVPVGAYPEGVTYIRQNHEVLVARSADMPFLYGPRDEKLQDSELGSPPDLIRALPASPATVKEFVGRSAVMDQLWHWLVYDDEPRTFLYGKGGSGKSTIAFEFAKLVALSTPYFKTSNGEQLDAVLYLSAKKSALNTNTGQIVSFSGNDFETADELFQQIIVLSEWLNLDDVEEMSMEDLRREIEELMDTITPLIVIDDIDTLTTLGRDPGMDALYRAAIRAKKGAKILYTLRNAPTQSLAQALEVPGLQDEEYRDFIRACCDQFNQPEPSDAIIDGPLSKSSERRPLIVEAVIGLRRTAGSYERALELLKQRAGDEIRSYVFEREYNALANDNRARYILAALSLSSKPLGFSDLEAVTRYNAQQLSDSLGEITEMFLSLVQDNSGETLYTLGQSTRDFIASRREGLDLFAQLRERVLNYTNTFSRQSKELTRLIAQVRKALYYYKDPKQALELLEGHRDNPKISEHPIYQTWVGMVSAGHSPPLLGRAREAFSFANDLGRLDASALRVWFYLERTSGTGISRAIKICNEVVGDERYPPKIRAEFCAKKGYALQTKAQTLGRVDPDSTLTWLSESLACNVDAYNRALDIAGMDVDRQSDWTSSCASIFGNACIEYDRVPLFFDTIRSFAKRRLVVDPVSSAISQICHRATRLHTAAEVDRAAGVMIQFIRTLKSSQGPLIFVEAGVRKEAISALERAVDACKKRREQQAARRQVG